MGLTSSRWSMDVCIARSSDRRSAPVKASRGIAAAMVVLASLLLLAAPQSARAQTEIWNATLTVGSYGNSRGFLTSPSRGSLSDTTFEASSLSFRFRALFVTRYGSGSRICVLFQPGFAPDHATVSALNELTLEVGEHTLPFEFAGFSLLLDRDYCWNIDGSVADSGFDTGSSLTARIVSAALQPTAEIVSLPRDGTTYRSGEVIRVVLWFEEDVRVSESPQIELEVGGRTRLATYVPARRGRTAAFEYTVTAADADADGVSIRANTDVSNPSLLLNGGAFQWVSFLRGEVVHLGFGAVPAGAGHAVDGANADTTAPTLSAATIRYGLLELTYSEPLRSDPQMMSGVATSAWSVTVNGAPAALTAAYIIDTVRLVLQSPVDHDDVVTVSSSVLMQDRAATPNTEAALLDGRSVTNETPAAKPVVEIAADKDAWFESETILLTVTRTGETAERLRVAVSYSNPALLGLAFPLVYLEAGESSAQLSVPTRRRRPAGDRPLVISLVPEDAYVIGAAGSASVTVRDADLPVTITTGSRVIFTEPSTSAVGSITVQAVALEESPVPPEFRFLFSTEAGTAEKDKDYRASDHRIGLRAEDFAIGPWRIGGQQVQRWQASRRIPIELFGDEEVEGDEYFIIRLEPDNTTPENVMFPATPYEMIITDDDLAIDVGIQDPPAQIAENAGRADITLTATVRRPFTRAVSSGVKLTLVEDSASVPGDVAWAEAVSNTIPVDLPASLYRPVTLDGEAHWRAVVRLRLRIHDDDVEEERERFRVNLTRDSRAPNSRYVEIDNAVNSARLTIVDDDRRGLVVNPTALDLEPGAEGSYTVALASEPTADVTVTATVPAADAGAVSLSPSSLAFTPGNWDTPQSLTVTAADDADGRTVEIANQAAGGDYGAVDPVAVEVEIASGAMQPAPPQLAVSDAAASEADDEIAFTVSLDAASTREVTVRYETENGTAEAGADFTGTDGLLTFAAGETSRTVAVPVIDDDAAEPGESFSLRLRAPANAVLGDALGIGRISDDDDLPMLSVEGATVSESAGTVDFDLTLSAPSGRAVTVQIRTADGTAVQGRDYGAVAGEVRFAAGEIRRVVGVPVTDDLVDEPDLETFTLTLSGPENATLATATAIGSIRDDEVSPVVSAGDTIAAETSGEMVFSVGLNASSERAVTVDYETVDVTATAESDYRSASGTLTFATGETAKSVAVTLLQDALEEGDEVLTLTLDDAVNARLGASGDGTIRDGGAPALRIADATAAEASGALEFVVTASGAAAREMRVAYATRDGTATAGQDYTETQGTLVFAVGEATKTIRVPVAMDSQDDEGFETLTVVLSGAVNATLADPEATGTISDTALPRLSVSDAAAVEEGEDAVFAVTLSAAAPQDVSFGYRTVDGSATSGADYTQAGGRLTIPEGGTEASIAVSTAADGLDEDDEETFEVRLEQPLYATIADGAATGTITDADAAPTLSVDNATTDEGESLEFAVTLSAASGLEVTVEYETADGTAVSPADYTETTGTLTFEPGQTERPVPVPVYQDRLDEPTETLRLVLKSPANAVFEAAEASARGVIRDDDDRPALELVLDPVEVAEQGETSAVLTVEIAGESAFAEDTTVGLALSGPAQVGVDYRVTDAEGNALADPWELVLGAGEDSATAQIRAIDDEVDEEVETVTIQAVRNGVDVGTARTLRIADDDEAGVVVSPAALTLAEGGTKTYMVALASEPTASVTVTVSSDNEDVTAGGPLTFTASDWSSAQTVTVTAAQDGDATDDTATLANTAEGGGYDGQSAGVTVTVTDDDTVPTAITLSVSPASVSESASGTTVTVTATLDGSATLLTATEVTVSVGGGTAASGTDYAEVGAFTVTIPKESASGTETFTLTPTQDTISEGDETIDVTGTADGFTVTKAEVTLTDDETAPASITLSVSPASVSESASGTAVTVTATLDGSATLLAATEVTVSVGGGSATSGTDFAEVDSFTVTIPKEAASETGTFTLTPTQDAIAEGDETIDVTGATDDFTVTKAEMTLTDDDTVPTAITLSVSPASVSESASGTTVTVTATLDGSATLLTATEVTVSVGGGTAASGADYAEVSDFAVTIPAQSASGTETFTLTPTQDTISEGDETIDVTGTADGFTVTKAEVTLTDDETAPASITLSVSPASVSESASGTTVTVTATLDGSATLLAATEVTVSVGGGSATSGTDFAEVDSFTVTIPKEAASGTGTFTLTPTQDAIAEGDETIDVTGTADGFTVTKAEVTLTDDETDPASITLSVSPASVSESASGTTVTVTATLGGSATLPDATEVTVSVGGGTATSGTDYAEVDSFTVTIPKEAASGTGTFTLTPTQDAIAEGDETIDVTGATDDFTVTKAEMTLTDDDTVPTAITLSVSPASVSESASGTTVTVTATLDGSATLLTATEVTVSVGGGTAASGADYAEVSDFAVTIPAQSASGTETFTLTPTQDTISEGDETIDVTGTADGFTVTKAEVTLTDDETAPASITLSVSPASVSESASGTAVTVTATLDGSATLLAATEVTVSVGGGSATSGTDFAEVDSFTVTIPKEAASGTGTFTLTPTQDAIAEGDETIDVTGATDDFTVTKAEMTLTDDDTVPTAITLSVSPASVSESASGTTVTVTATLDGSATLLTATEVTVSVGGGTAASGADYAEVSDFAVTIPAQSASGTETFTLTPTQDTISEGDETIDVTGTADGFTVTKAEVTLTDDETAPASITLSVSPASVSESASGTTVTVTATLDGSATLLAATEVTVSVGGGSATSGTDFAEVDSFTVTIPKEAASGTGTFTLTPTQDAIAEGDETIDVTGTADGFTVTKAEVTLTDDETDPASITLSVSPASVSESASGTTVTVTATLGGSATLPDATEVTVSVGGGTATSGTDYAEVDSFTVTIPKEAASETGTFTLTPTQDTIAEGDETIDVTGAADGFTVTKAEMTLTDDDTVPTAITLSVSPASVSESASGTTVTVTATLDGSATLLTATEVTVSVGGGTAASGADYAEVSDFAVTIPAQSASGTETFTLTPANDSLAEGDETIDVTGAADGFTVTKAEMTLTDDDTVPTAITLSVSPASVSESASGTTVTVTATLDGSATLLAATEVTVSVGGGSATSGTDFAEVDSFTVTIPKEAASGTGTFTLTPTQDAIAEGDETIDVTGTADGFTVTKAEVTLTDDETDPASITLSVSPASVSESASGTTVTVTATLGGSATLPDATEVTVSVGGGTATSGTDYAEVDSFTVTIPKEAASETGTFTLTPTQDTIAEGDETIDVTGAADGFTVTKAEMTLTDDDTVPTAITLSVSPASVSESASGTTVTVTATLDGSVTLSTATEVTVSVGGGTAASGADYAEVSDFAVTIPAQSASGTETFTLTPANDSLAEGDESIDVTGSAADFTVTKAQVTLTDDDTAPTAITLSVSPASVSESASGTTVTVTATLDGSATLLTATEVTVSVGGGTAASGADYAEVSDFAVTIPAQSASGTETFTLTPANDSLAEGDESIDVTGSAADFTVTKAQVTLTDDDTAPTAITLSVSPASVSESASGTTVTVTATLDGSATLLTATEVTVSVGGGTAASGTDYAEVGAFTVTIPKETASETGTFTLTPTQDAIAEGDETIDVTGAADDFTVTKAEMTLTDDDTVPTAITLSVSPASVSESASGTTVTVTATLDGSATLLTATEVTVSVGGGTAASGTDYAEVGAFTVTIPKETASGTGTFTLMPTQDTISEGDETIDVTGTADGFTVTKAEVTLTDDETAPASITLSVSPASVSESASGTAVTVTATLDGSATLLAATEVTVSVGGGSATSGTDFAEVDSFTVTIPKEAASETGTFTLTPTQDTIAEGDETIDVTGAADGFTVTKAEMTLTDDDTVPTAITLSVSPASVSESASGTAVTVTATLDGSATLLAATEVTVSVGGGSATSGTDFAEVGAFTVTIPKEAASGTGTFTLTPTQDAIAEGDETIDVTGAADDFTVTKAEMTLTDDDTVPTAITLSVSPASVSESASGTTVTVTATLDGSATLLTATEVTVSVGGGTAASGADYAEVGAFTVTIPKETASGTGTFTLMPTQDTISEGDETIDVTGTADGFTVTKAEVTLTDDETAPASITLSVSPASVSESASGTAVTVTATLDGSATLLTATEVTVSVGGGTAASGADYAEVGAFTVTIPKETASGTETFTLTPTQDTISEGDESIDVTGSADDFTVTKAEMTLTDDETAPASITLTVSPTSVSEDDDATTVTVTATLDGSARLLAAIEVTVSVGGGTAASGTDYAEVGAFTVTIPAQSASGTETFTLTPTQDTLAEGDETIDVTGAADGFTVTKAEVTLTDDETAPASITLTVSPTSVSEDDDATTVTVTATLDGSATLLAATEVTVSVGGGSATSGTDFAAVDAFTVTIPKEAASGTGTFTLTPTQDAIAEGDETIDVTGTADDFTVTKAEMTLTDDVPQRTVSFDKHVFMVTEGTTRQVLMQVDLSGPMDREVAIPLTTTHESGAEANDYVLAAIGVEDYYGGNDAWTSLDGDLIFVPAETAKIVQVTAVDDSIVEEDEVLELGFGTLPEGISPGPIVVARVTITDNDDAPTPRATLHLSDADGEVAEDAGIVTVTATVSPASTIAFTMTVSASPVAPATDADFELSTNRVLRFAATASTGTVTIAPVDDAEADPTRVITVAGSASVSGVTAPDDVTLTILDNDAPRIRGICDRTPRVRDRILVRLKYQHGFKHTCAEVTEADLVKLTLLDLRRNSSNEPAFTLSLQQHDFEGLSNLVELDLADNGLESLPAGVFNGLANLETLNLNNNRLRSLPPWVFADLRSLETLRLQKNPSLRSLPYDELEEIPALTLLRVDRVGRRKLQVAGGESDAALDIAAGDSATYRVRLMAAPDFRITATNPVSIGVNSDTAGVTASPETLPFTRENWFRRQTVTVRAEASASGAMATLAHEPSGTTTDSQGQAQSNYDFESYPLPKLTVRVGFTDAAGNKERLTSAATGKVAARPQPEISVADARADEGAGATLDFEVTLSAPAPGPVTVDYRTVDASAKAGADYAARQGTLTFRAGETMKTVSVPVLDDSHDEGREILVLTLDNARGGVLADRIGVGTIENADPLQRAWLSRFGRMAALQVVDHVEARMAAHREPGFRGRFAGRELRRGMERDIALSFLQRLGRTAAPGPIGGMATPTGGMATPMGMSSGRPGGGPDGVGLGAGDLLTGSDFALDRETDRGGIVSFWSRGSMSRFSGREGALSLGGDVRTTMFGADYAQGPLTAGLMLSHSRGLGEYAGVDGGVLHSSVTGLFPWLGYRASGRVSAWAVTGYGSGGLMLTPDGVGALESGLSMAMAAVGARGALAGVAGASGGTGFGLSFKADALWVGTSIEGVDGAAGSLKATASSATRVRTALEASGGFIIGGLSLRPSVEAGLRHDGGDAETGSGLDLGGGLAASVSSTGLTVEVRLRTLLAHEAEGYSERGASVQLSWNPSPSTPLGFNARLSPSWGVRATGGAEALWGRETMAGVGARNGPAAGNRLEAEAGYGLPLGGRFVGTPRVGVRTSESGRDYLLGWSVGVLGGGALNLSLGVDAHRRENPRAGGAAHGVAGRVGVRW